MRQFSYRHIVAAKSDVSFNIAERTFCIRQDETIHTESSRKYQPEETHLLLRASGWSPVRHWTDERTYFFLILAESDVPSDSCAPGYPSMARKPFALAEK